MRSVPPTHLNITGNLTLLQFAGYVLPGLFLLLGDQNMYKRLASAKGKRESRFGTLG